MAAAFWASFTIFLDTGVGLYMVHWYGGDRGTSFQLIKISITFKLIEGPDQRPSQSSQAFLKMWHSFKVYTTDERKFPSSYDPFQTHF